ncbi:SRPBCC family protein [Nonomuraea cavernae]|uniref:SRPBCC family protein n=1 Tax=Nonomuraea cavernae TaxID=2045107 RepID=UPI0033DCB2C0
MSERFEVRWEGELPASPREVWDAFTVHTAGWCWKISYEPWAGGAEQGLTSGGTVSVWDPPRHFTTRSADGSNELDYVLEPSAAGAFLRYRHRGETAENHERELDACQRHTAFYYHSLGEYLRHFSGRDAAYVSAEAPESSAKGGFAALRRALGLPGDLAVGDRVRLRPAGLEPIDGVVDYVTSAFLGVRGDDALYRFYGRDVWGWPVGVAHHLFAAGADEAHHTRAWSAWLDGVFATEAG